MQTWKIITILGVAIVAVALITASAFAFMGARGIYTPYAATTGTANPYGTFGGMMGGMMNGYANGYPTTAPPAYSGQYITGGCMGRGGYYVGTPASSSATPISITTAVGIAQQYVGSLGNKDLAVDEVEEYTLNFYVLVKENSTGRGAFELLINKVTGAVSAEPGPNMMWNAKYGMMSSGMMGWITGTTTAGPMTITVDQAKADAQAFLNVNYPGTTVGNVDTFYGYYHIDVVQADTTYGMLSVNGYTGQVWYHTWHGAFIQAVEL
jgi:hypothetical protein